MSRDMSLGLTANLQSLHGIADLFGDHAAPPGFRHRRFAPELA